MSERLVGTRGSADPSGRITGEAPWTFAGTAIDGQLQEHVDLIRSIRAGRPINHCRRIAESTLTAILGRVSAYTGREVSFAWLLEASKLDLSPPEHAFGDAPSAPVPIPGIHPLV